MQRRGHAANCEASYPYAAKETTFTVFFIFLRGVEILDALMSFFLDDIATLAKESPNGVKY